MTDQETLAEPLVRAPSQQTAINVEAPSPGSRSTRAYKVAGLTVLGCVLIMGQAMIAYFLLSQRSDIRSLEEQSNNLKTELTRARSVSVSKEMHVPMNTMLLDDTLDEEASTGVPGKSEPGHMTSCRLEASGLKPVQVPGFRPACDERGLYRAQQCFMERCWCVNPTNGQQINGVFTKGQTRCMVPLIGGLSETLALSPIED